MNKFINYTEFMHDLIDDEKKAEKGGEIVQGILAAKSPQLTRIANEMVGQSESNYKAIHRFMGEADVKEALLRMYIEEILFVICLNLGDQHKQPRLIDAEGNSIKLFVRPGKTVIHHQAYYLGTVPVNLIGHWRKGLSNPLWVISSLEPKAALRIFQNRMEIEMTFRHAKDLLHLPKLMNKRQDYLEKMIALTLMAFIIALLFGEAQRDVTYGNLDPQQIQESRFGDVPEQLSQHRKWRPYSGPFVLLIQKPKLSDDILALISQAVLALLPILVYGNNPSIVRLVVALTT